MAESQWSIASAAGNRREPRLRLRQCEARLQPSDSIAENPGTAQWLGKGRSGHSEGAKHLRVAGNRRSRMAKSRWQNPDNRQGIVVEPEGAADNVRIGAKGTAPQAIADHGFFGETRYEVLGTEQPSKL